MERRSREDLLIILREMSHKLREEDFSNNALFLDADFILVIPRKTINGKCDYVINFKEFITEKYYVNDILYALPVDDELFCIEIENTFVAVKDYDDIIIIKKVDKLKPAPLEHLHMWFDGLPTNSYMNQVFIDEKITVTLKKLEYNCFKNCQSTGKLSIPSHLLTQLVCSGLDCQGQVELIGTGSFGLTGKIYKRTVYHHFLMTDYTLCVYFNKLTVMTNHSSEEKEFITDFYWKKFYNNIDEMIICMYLHKYNVALNSYVTLGLSDIFNDLFNTLE